MIPIGDQNVGQRRVPVVNYVLIAINVLVFLYELSLPQDALQRFVQAYGAVPFEITHGVDLPPGVRVPIYLTIVTSMFIHGGWLHIGGNMLYLWIFGDNIENSTGHLRYLLFYLLGGTAAALTQIYAGGPDSTDPLIGASGAIAAVLGAYLVLYPSGLVRVLIFLGIFVTIMMFPAIIVIGFWFLLQLLSSVAALGARSQETGGVAYLAHVGGFVSGVVMIWIFRDRAAVALQKSARRGMRAWERR